MVWAFYIKVKKFIDTIIIDTIDMHVTWLLNELITQVLKFFQPLHTLGPSGLEGLIHISQTTPWSS